MALPAHQRDRTDRIRARFGWKLVKKEGLCIAISNHARGDTSNKEEVEEKRMVNMGMKILGGLVVLAMVATATEVVLVLAQENLGLRPSEGMQLSEGNRSHLVAPLWFDEQCDELNNLTEEDRAAIQRQMEEFSEGLRVQYGDNPSEEDRAAMDQELQTFWEQLCEEYSISCPDRPWGAGQFNGSVGPGQYNGENRSVPGEQVGFNASREREQRSGTSGPGFVTQVLASIQTFFRNLLGR
jgi:hypothetical protein